MLRRSYASKNKINTFIDKVGNESTKESQRTIKVIRTIGAGSVIAVICSLIWASSMSAPVKESFEEVPNLSKDVRLR